MAALVLIGLMLCLGLQGAEKTKEGEWLTGTLLDTEIPHGKLVKVRRGYYRWNGYRWVGYPVEEAKAYFGLPAETPVRSPQ